MTIASVVIMNTRNAQAWLEVEIDQPSMIDELHGTGGFDFKPAVTAAGVHKGRLTLEPGAIIGFHFAKMVLKDKPADVLVFTGGGEDPWPPPPPVGSGSALRYAAAAGGFAAAFQSFLYKTIASAHKVRSTVVITPGP